MSGKVKRVPKKIQDMIGSIKEIAGSHSDEEIHAMLKECSMDPNEAAQRLLEQDPFHEVTRKRDKKKELTWRGSRGIQPKKHSPPTTPIPPLLHGSQLSLKGTNYHAPTKEWKPKTTNPPSSAHLTPTTISQESTSNQLVIIPHHLQVPQAQRSGFSFGSFDANFGLSTPCISNQVESLTTPEGDYSGHPQSPKTVPSLAEADVSSSAGREYERAKQEIAAPQYSLVHTAPNYNFGFMPPILGAQFAPFDTSELQARDASRLPSFFVQQAFDPSASYYTQFYGATGEGDGRFPAANKYNGGVSVESTATSSTTPPAAVMQQSQQLAVFRQPHLAPPHYPPPNYIPYSSQYFSPQFYMPPPQTIHHYLTTNPAAAAAAFQQPSVYPPPPPPAAAGVKFSLSSQFKPPATTTSTATAASGNEELSSNYNKEYITGGQQQQKQQASEGSGVWIPGRDIYPSSFYSLSPHWGQHVTFAAAPATAAFYHQTAQSQQSGVEMYQQQQQQPQRAQLSWTANY